MKYLTITFICFALGFSARSQDNFNINWLYDDISQYDTYTISDFTINQQSIDYREAPNAIRFIELFNRNMNKIGMDYDSAAVLSANFTIQLDTLAAGFQRLDGIKYEDRLIDFTLTLVDDEVNEKLLDANLQTFTKGPKKLDKELRKILKIFFAEVKMRRSQ